MTYSKNNDYLIPNLSTPKMTPIGKYGVMRKRFLKEFRKGIYTGMLIDGSINNHLIEIDNEANRVMENLIEKMKKQEGVSEQLKMENQMRWVQMMNSICSRAGEVVKNELIYQ